MATKTERSEKRQTALKEWNERGITLHYEKFSKVKRDTGVFKEERGF